MENNRYILNTTIVKYKLIYMKILRAIKNNLRKINTSLLRKKYKINCTKNKIEFLFTYYYLDYLS